MSDASPQTEVTMASGAPADTPLRKTMKSGRTPEPQALVIFGATGDLTRRKLMPAVYKLFCDGLLPEHFAVVGFAREAMTEDEFRRRMREALGEFATKPGDEEWARFAPHLAYVGSVFEDPEGFLALRRRLEELDREQGTGGNRLYYLAVPPGVMELVAEQLGRAGLVCDARSDCFSRIIVEKPFGHDLESAQQLNADLHRVFDERQVFRIDHYLGKETTQNILVFRFGNVIWEPVWNRTFVDHVEITVAETVGVEQRAGYYEKAGALRDMVQSHLLQVLALVAMEPPASYDADSIRTEKVKVLRSIRPIRGEDVAHDAVRGQYAASEDGKAVGYRAEPNVDPQSRTETFAALRLWIDNWRWADVPFYVRTGKRLKKKVSEVVVRFRPAPHPILDNVEGDRPAPNALVLKIQPQEGISLFFEAKVPGMRGELRPVSMDFDYSRAFQRESPEAYQRLLLDAMVGDATLFAREDEVVAAWTLITPILEEWARTGEPEAYPAGSWGPACSDRLIGETTRAEDRGREWREP
ncbi:glucose-6-phosphate dehydrogenase [Longimicrobium sp.]|uniref:glucose-6-phosphate dehydrogenase n=1 Tax=Longimicrobium sp. TaxID=2029185 RepID=UPI002C2AD73B|nr:glucose-6-phosphate dehydrogenase [Longimicrobium sp.]HSU13311.1 glucose-6-phosphate dehydrogenase [Longimicrobium sp.]